MFLKVHKNKDINTQEEFHQLVRDVAAVGPHPDIPINASLTGRQLYVEFCYRMAKFDDEFRTLDPVIAGTWLNTGMARMLQEMQKRLFKAEQDIDVVPFFRGFFKEIAFTQIDMTRWGDAYEYKYVIPDDEIVQQVKYSTAPLKIMLETDLVVAEDPDDGEFDFPKYIPHKVITDEEMGINYMVGVPFSVDYREITELEVQHKQFICFNSFSSAGQFPPRVYVHKHNSGEVNIYIDSFRFEGYATSDRRQEPLLAHWKINKIVQELVLIEKLYEKTHIDAQSNERIIYPPIEFHHDIVDYAIDAYFESIFFQSFGKYSMKMARRDADMPGNVTTGGSQYKNKLDSVPPTRYRLSHGAAAQM